MTKKRIVKRKKFVPPVLPEKPKVTVGAKSFGRSRSGGYIIPRFWITQSLLIKRTPKKSDPWYVIDMETGYLAKGTKAYPEKDKAIRIARKYRDEFGAWYVMPF